MILLNYPAAFIFAVFSTMAFAVLFQAPKKFLPVCGAVGAVGWLVFIHLRHGAGLDSFYANLASAFVVTLLSELAARILLAPATIFVLPGIFPIVPGLGIYNGMSKLIEHDYLQGSALLLTAGLDAIAIAFGIMFVGSLFRVWKISCEHRHFAALWHRKKEELE